MQQLREMIGRVARSQAPVYIYGESGTGKELVARLIHQSGARAEAPFVPVNCGAIPTELMESELFGHKRGSFTGAVADKKGLIQSAEGGTLFLDEVADLPLHMQVKLLRVVQEKTVRPVGESREERVDVRILSATHRNLADLVAAGRFREDLFYRINVIELRVPPLRERSDDIPDLAATILERMCRRMKIDPPVISPEAHAGAAGLCLSRQCPGAREHHRARPDADHFRRHHAGARQAAAGDAGRVPGSGADLAAQASRLRRCAAERRLAGATACPWRSARGHRARRHHQGAGADPLQQDRRREAAGDDVSRAALSHQEAGDRVNVAGRRHELKASP